MSLLYKNLRIHQIFGANTDVGKTILTSALVRASAARNTPVFYLKPVSTGHPEDADDRHIKRYSGNLGLLETECLYRYDEPVSPHLAARLKDNNEAKIPSDKAFLKSVSEYVQRCASNIQRPSHLYIETAGGVHSPTLAGTTQVDCYRPLFFPTVLVGDSKLGGISSTISAYESLVLRGYIIDAVLLFRDEYYRNWEYLRPYFADRGVHVSAVKTPPAKHPDPATNAKLTEEYYSTIVPTKGVSEISTIVTHLDQCHARRLEDLDSMPKRTLQTIWWPFVQHGLFQEEKDVTLIDSAYSDFFSVYNKYRPSDGSSLLSPEFDSSASWWTQTVGHAHPSLTLAAARASGRYGHVMFPRATHLPALNLAESLVRGPGKGWASRAYFSDNGSAGMEIALKMALRAYTVRQGGELNKLEKKALGVLGLKGSYHGDTIGAMDACEEGIYTCEWHDAKGYWFEPPTIGIRSGDLAVTLPPAMTGSDENVHLLSASLSLSGVYDINDRLRTPLARKYRDYIQNTLENIRRQGGPRLAALVIEPLLMGAGGMIFVDPLFQRVMIDVVRGPENGFTSNIEWPGLPVIFDEVFVGLHRIGLRTTSDILQVSPDIAVYAKILTGGLVPLAVTLASESIFDAFLSGRKEDALLHGHSYTAHALGCEVANETLRLIDKLQSSQDWLDAQRKWTDPATGDGLAWSFWAPDFVKSISMLGHVEEVMTLGCVLAIKLKDSSAGYTSHSAEIFFGPLREIQDSFVSVGPFSPFGIHFRTLGNVAYFMTSLNTAPSVIRSVENRIWKALNER
ncbi:hypothetical protein AMATHDRAFT_138291 [Amanita thiersii Skay4041]|uniref:Dethiobiotin synthase n=1 Tax=Amanita thiersii Skay4041 TaxID=703135 RepID=A0A2A9NYY8_9AGAR|nr:hypothetical protein AMATHDRAFT_138291 [Amanita thiersii Skay4041]